VKLTKLLITLATLAPANSQSVRFHDVHGRVTGSANGTTTFYDASGRVTGSAHAQAPR
jgi:hypothetical protein